MKHLFTLARLIKLFTPIHLNLQKKHNQNVIRMARIPKKIEIGKFVLCRDLIIYNTIFAVKK
jgi:hypothetical protein